MLNDVIYITKTVTDNNSSSRCLGADSMHAPTGHATSQVKSVVAVLNMNKSIFMNK